MSTAIAEPTADQKPYRPYGSARELMLYRDPRVITEAFLAGPAGTGKSRACLEKLHLCALKYPGMRGLIVRKTRSSLTQTGLVTFEEKVLPDDSTIKLGPLRQNRQSYLYPNGSEIVVGGLDKATRIMSTEFDIAYIQEAVEVTLDDHESITTRLRNGVMPYQQLIADTNPDGPRHWIKLRERAGSLRLLESRHEDNPRLYDAAAGDWTPEGRRYIAKLDELTGVRYHRLRKGLWVAAEGIIYEDWDPHVHQVDRFEIPSSWRRIRSIDFGYTNPFSCSWYAVDHDGRAYRYRQIYKTKTTVGDHATRIRNLSAGESIEATVSDHDAEDRATLHQAGIATLPAHKAVQPGIEAVQHRMRRAGDGRPRLFFLRDSLVDGPDPDLIDSRKPTCTEEEMDSYVWLPAKEGRAAKEEPLKVNDHGVDELRYAVAYLDGLTGQACSAVFAPPRPDASIIIR